MVSSHWSNIDPECRVLARCYPMRMKPFWMVSLDCISAQQHKFTHKYGECFYWVEQQNKFAWKIYIVCFHVGQMLFAGNKYLLLKRITVWLQRCSSPITKLTLQTIFGPVLKILGRNSGRWQIWGTLSFFDFFNANIFILYLTSYITYT